MKKIALRIDVDTYRGTKLGVPNLCNILRDFNIKATFYFSVGPDNMGRHLWRLLKPAFLWKMLRTNAAGLYGPEIILMGTMWPGPLIGKKFANIIKKTADEGHEIGLHAWDHHKIQSKTDKMTSEDIYKELSKGMSMLTDIIGFTPVSSAAPAWRCNDNFLREKAKFDFKFNSDCRGEHIFRSKIGNQIQIPVTMPTYDEVCGKNGINDSNYNDYMIKQLKPDKLNVLTIHAEAEGGKCSEMFRNYLKRVIDKGWDITTLGSLLDNNATIPDGEIIKTEFPGREGWLAVEKLPTN